MASASGGTLPGNAMVGGDAPSDTQFRQTPEHADCAMTIHTVNASPNSATHVSFQKNTPRFWLTHSLTGMAKFAAEHFCTAAAKRKFKIRTSEIAEFAAILAIYRKWQMWRQKSVCHCRHRRHFRQTSLSIGRNGQFDHSDFDDSAAHYALSLGLLLCVLCGSVVNYRCSLHYAFLFS